jgi:dienelactone hydrolase
VSHETPSHPPREIRFEVSPSHAFIDEDVRIRLSGLAPQREVRVHATTEDDEKRRWSSTARFRADALGQVDLSTHESLGGSYRGVASMGIFWSMRLTDESDTRRAGSRTSFAKKDSTPQWVTLETELERSEIVSVKFERIFCAPGTVVRDLTLGNGDAVQPANETGADARTRGRVGRLFLPPAAQGGARHPAVIVLSGSGGGFDLDKAAVLSRHGFATLALAYFGEPPLAPWLHRVPVEHIESALAWLAAQREIDANRIGLLGVSRGAELALLSATRFAKIRAVVAYAPTSVAWDSGGRDKQTRQPIPAWTWRGEPVASAPLPLRGFMWRSAIPVVALRRPVMFKNLFGAGLKNSDAVARAAIPVEQINGSLLLSSGGDDHVWPAAAMAEAILARLKDRGFRHAVEHLHYPAAGHLLRYPHLPTTARHSQHEHLRGARFSFGGSARADAEAQADAWRRTIAFLKNRL